MQRACVGLFGVMTFAMGCADAGGPREHSLWGAGDTQAILDDNPEARLATIHAPDGRDLVVMYVVDGDRAVSGGDIVLGDADEIESGFRAASIEGRLWPGSKVRWLDDGISASKRQMVLSAMAQWEAATVITFEEITAAQQGDYGHIRVQEQGDCSSGLGYPGAGNSYALRLHLCDEADVEHELGHAIGLFHEQTRTDRDAYVDILWDNIPEASHPNYARYEDRGKSGRDRGAYDFDSIMHYPSYPWPGAPQPTMLRKDGSVIERNTSLSSGDIAAVDAMYADAPAEPEVVSGSCENRCGAINLVELPDGSKCSCNETCHTWEDCCADYVALCEPDAPTEPDAPDEPDAPAGGGGDGGGDGGGSPSSGDGSSCAGHCESSLPQPGGCYCDEVCESNGDCCPDHATACGDSPQPDPTPSPMPTASCAGICGASSSPDGSCFCDPECADYGDCCADYTTACGT